MSIGLLCMKVLDSTEGKSCSSIVTVYKRLHKLLISFDSSMLVLQRHVIPKHSLTTVICYSAKFNVLIKITTNYYQE